MSLAVAFNLLETTIDEIHHAYSLAAYHVLVADMLGRHADDRPAT